MRNLDEGERIGEKIQPWKISDWLNEVLKYSM